MQEVRGEWLYLLFHSHIIIVGKVSLGIYNNPKVSKILSNRVSKA